jgi:isovaleryl-CoA dehydrogenase
MCRACDSAVNEGSMGVEAREFAAAKVAGTLAERERAGFWDAGLWRAMGAAGLLGVSLPVEHGGGGRSAVALHDALIGFAEGSLDAGLAHAWAAHAIGCGNAITRFGTLAQRRRHVPALACGERVGAFARIEGTARSIGTSFCLDGRARVLNGPVADLFVVAAKLEGGGWASFVVERGAADVHVGEREDCEGLRTASIGELRFVNCELGADALLGERRSAEPLAFVRRWQRACELAAWVGLLGELVRICLARARGRSQVIRALLADMQIRVELCRHVQARAAWRLEHDEAARELAVASVLLGEAITTLPHAAANAFPTSTIGDPIARMARDATVAGQLWEGPERARAALAASMFEFGESARSPA